MEYFIGIGGLVVGLAGVGVTVLTVYWNGKQRERERLAAERDQEQRQAVSVLAPVLLLLDEMTPLLIGREYEGVLDPPAREDARAIVDRLERQWLAARGAVITAHIAHRDERVRDLAEELIGEVHTAMDTLRAWVRGSVDRAGVYEDREKSHRGGRAASEFPLAVVTCIPAVRTSRRSTALRATDPSQYPCRVPANVLGRLVQASISGSTGCCSDVVSSRRQLADLRSCGIRTRIKALRVVLIAEAAKARERSGMRRWALLRKKRASTQRAGESIEVDDERAAEEAAEERRRQYGQERVQMALSRGDFDAIAWMAARYTAETTYEHRYASDALRESGAQGVDAMVKVLDREGFNDYLVDLLVEADDPRAVPVFKKALSSLTLSAYGSHWRRKIEEFVSRFDPEAKKAAERRAQEAERREQGKQDQLQRARAEVRGYDEATMLELRRVCRAYSSAVSGDDQEIDELEAVATAIGERLDSIGGIQKMREVFYLLEGIPGARTLEMHWSGIGDWRAEPLPS